MANPVRNIMNRAGMECHLPVATATTANGVVANVNEAAANAASYADLATAIVGQQSDNSNILNSGPQQASGGPSIINTIAGTAATMGLAVFAPVPAAILGAGMAVAGIVNFSTGHAAIDGAQGEYTLAANAATFDEKGDMTSYTSACDGTTTDMKGQAVSSPVAMGQTSPQAQGMHNLKDIIADEMSGEDVGQAVQYLKKQAEKNINVVNSGLYKLDEMGAVFENDPTARDIKQNMADVSEVMKKLDTPKPMKALNVGMGSPSFG